MKSPCKVKRNKRYSLVSVTEPQEHTGFQKHIKEGRKEGREYFMHPHR